MVSEYIDSRVLGCHITSMDNVLFFFKYIHNIGKYMSKNPIVT